MEDLTGRQFGPYQIVAPLGEGGMAAVYKAYQPAMERYVALKVLPRHFADNTQFAARFQREAKLVAQLQHPHILPVFDFGQAEGYSYIVMPFVQGGALTHLLQGQPLPLPRIRQVISQVGEALDYAHRRGVVHRDVKPSNVLLDEGGNCLLTDFGLARMVEASVNLTTSGTIMGTPAYMSPEQGSGQKTDARSDIYSLGVILYEMATGRVPYRAETPIAVVYKHIQDPLPPPRTVNPRLPEAVERVILKALAKRAEDRYQTAGDMVRALQLAIPDLPARRASALPREAAKTEPPRTAVVEREVGPKPVSRPKRGAPSRIWLSIGAVILVLAIAGGFWAYRQGKTPSSRPATATSIAAMRTPTAVSTATRSAPSPISATGTATRIPTATVLRASPTPVRPELLIATGELRMGQELIAVNKRYSFRFQSDGNLVVYDNVGGTALWSSNTAGSQADRLVMQTDGNLVLSKAGSLVWQSGSGSVQGGYFLQMQDAGNLVILRGEPYGANAVPIWATGSGPAAGTVAKPVKVAVVGPLTGSVATFGEGNKNGALLAIEEWNAKGGPAGHRIEYVLGDSQCDPKAAADVAMKVVDEDKVGFIIGAVCSSETIPIAEYAGPKKVLLISGTSTNPGVTVAQDGKTRPYAFRACFIDPFQGKVMAKFALDNLKAKTAAVVLDVGNDYIKGLAEFFKDAFEKGGGKVVAYESYAKEDTDFSAILAKVKNANPDVFFVPTYYDKVNLIGAQAKQRGITCPLLGGDGWDSPDLDKAAVDGGYFSNHYHPGDTRPIVVEWIKKFKAKYGTVPDALATLGYDAANLMFAAIDKAKSIDPDAVAKALQGISYDCVSGKVTFDAQHNPVKSAVVLKVTGGEVKYAATVAP